MIRTQQRAREVVDVDVPAVARGDLSGCDDRLATRRVDRNGGLVFATNDHPTTLMHDDVKRRTSQLGS